MEVSPSDRKRRRVDEAATTSVAADADVPAEEASTSKIIPAAAAAAAATASAACAASKGEARERKLASNNNHEIYAFRDGYRYAVPWWDTWQSFVKGKWIGKRLYDTLLQHLPLEAADVEESFKEGAVLIYPNQKSEVPVVVDASHVLRSNERIVYTFHRHEPELYCSEVKLLEVTKDFVIVRKPATVPMHPIGRFKHNTLIEILANEHPEFGKLKITHRLDRLVSGLLILARTQKIAVSDNSAPHPSLRMCYRLKSGERTVNKTYIARIRGKLSQQRVEVATPIGITLADPPTYGTVPEADGGKPSRTTFEHFKTLPDGSSLVWCHPATGRTHQIRVHLQSIGHPILNDPKYNGGIKTDVTAAPSPPAYTLEPGCKECQSGGWKSRNPDDPTITSKGIYLHAVKYTFRSSNPVLLAAVADRAIAKPTVNNSSAAAAAAAAGAVAADVCAAAAAAAAAAGAAAAAAASAGVGAAAAAAGVGASAAAGSVVEEEGVVEWEFADGLPAWANNELSNAITATTATTATTTAAAATATTDNTTTVNASASASASGGEGTSE